LLEFWHKRRLAAGDIDAAAMAFHTQRLAELADAPAHFPIPDRTHAGGDVMDLGGGQTIHVIHTPGHTPGSCSFYVPRARALLGGDSLTGSAGEGRFPLLSNVVTYRQTVLDVQHLDVEFVGPAHRYPFRPPANPVVTPARPGDLARTFLADTLTTALDIEAGTAEAWQANRHGPRRALVADALIRVGARLGIDLSGSDHARAAVGLWLDVFGAPTHIPA
ncbi:MAG: MBL fold metallo-hydrolase, partial [Proteobacteria bacterium]|nr:MBL fold metallo-hydrolase [Pseudomonadota bacterium]